MLCSMHTKFILGKTVLLLTTFRLTSGSYSCLPSRMASHDWHVVGGEVRSLGLRHGGYKVSSTSSLEHLAHLSNLLSLNSKWFIELCMIVIKLNQDIMLYVVYITCMRMLVMRCMLRRAR